MIDLLYTIESVGRKFDEKENKKLNISVFVNLVKAVATLEDNDLELTAFHVVELLKKIEYGNKEDRKAYIKGFKGLKKIVKESYGLSARGDLKEESMAIGIGMGVAIGAAFTTFNPGLMAIGIPIGVAMGAAMGANREKEAEKLGKLY